MLTQEGREGAIYEMDNKAEIEHQREEEAKEQFALAKQEVVASDDYDEETKEQLLIEMNDSMPVIGYKRQKYSGSCWKKALPDRRWLLVDTTYKQRGYMRFDSRSNYGRFGSVTYVKVY